MQIEQSKVVKPGQQPPPDVAGIISNLLRVEPIYAEVRQFIFWRRPRMIGLAGYLGHGKERELWRREFSKPLPVDSQLHVPINSDQVFYISTGRAYYVFNKFTGKLTHSFP